MASSETSARPQLYLITPPVADAAAFAPLLEAVLAAGEVSCLLLDIAAGDDHAAKRIVKDLAPLVQPGGTALLLRGWPSIVARSGADGIHHIGNRGALREALESFKPERIVGCGGIRSRDDAMSLAESGADYVMFGEPFADGRTPPLDAILERTGWWTEL